ncbi:MAG: M28 family peptidase [Gemmatimonadota bacterium]|nr:M28 family peptidase [Gemmatimonadota bacterium]
MAGASGTLALVVGMLGGCTQKPDAPPPVPVVTTEFDGEAALKYTAAQVAFGPRVPGSEGHRKAGDWIVAQMKQRGATVVEQTWSHTTKDGRVLPLRNIIARFNPAAKERVLYLTHWDTRPTADMEPDPANQATPIDGANDGASGVGLFVALADALQQKPVTLGVDLLFVDGEDYGSFGPPLVDVLLGSTYFAKHLPDPAYNPVFGVLFDMIGDADLRIAVEDNSVQRAPEVVQRVWAKAESMGRGDIFVRRSAGPITDDHIPLLDVGLKVIDVIDLDYGPGNSYHHTLQDTMDKVSAQSLKVVGDVALALLR